jgi:hypothetical protein
MGGIQKAEKYQREVPKSKRTHKERVTLSGRNDLPCRCSQRTLPSISGPGARLVSVAKTLWWSMGFSTDKFKGPKQETSLRVRRLVRRSEAEGGRSNLILLRPLVWNFPYSCFESKRAGLRQGSSPKSESRNPKDHNQNGRNLRIILSFTSCLFVSSCLRGKK